MRLYTAEEAAKALAVSKWTVWRYGREGKLKTVHFGRTVRYQLEESNEQRRYQSEDPRNGRRYQPDFQLEVQERP